MTSWRRGIESGPEAVAGLAMELQGPDPHDAALKDALYLSEKFPGELVSELWSSAGNAATIGITGTPGVGKSTMIPRLVSGFREQELTVGVIAVDPSSPFTGGSLMGDRGRMIEAADNHDYKIALDKGVWIRSFSAAGDLGGISGATLPSILAFDVSGKDVIVVETVGVGQSELEVSSLVDTTVVVLQPGSGDSVQAMKAGVMEVPDILCVNNRDIFRPEVVGDLRSNLSELRQNGVPLKEINAATGEGMEDLLTAIKAHREKMGEAGLQKRRQQSLGSQLIQLSLAYSGMDIKKILESKQGRQMLEEVGKRNKDPFTAARELREFIK